MRVHVCACVLYTVLCRFDECVTGGESILLDAYPVVEEFRRTHPKHFDTLTRIPVRLFISHYTE